MPVTSTKIGTYALTTISAGDPNDLAATIWLFDGKGKTLAFLGFYRPDATMPANEFRTDLDHAVVSCPFDTFAPTVDMLRNEKPAYFTWFDYSPTNCFGAVETGREPVGEAERLPTLGLRP